MGHFHLDGFRRAADPEETQSGKGRFDHHRLFQEHRLLLPLQYSTVRQKRKKPPVQEARRRLILIWLLVAGAGFEPATFRL